MTHKIAHRKRTSSVKTKQQQKHKMNYRKKLASAAYFMDEVMKIYTIATTLKQRPLESWINVKQQLWDLLPMKLIFLLPSRLQQITTDEVYEKKKNKPQYEITDCRCYSNWNNWYEKMVHFIIFTFYRKCWTMTRVFLKISQRDALSVMIG